LSISITTLTVGPEADMSGREAFDHVPEEIFCYLPHIEMT